MKIATLSLKHIKAVELRKIKKSYRQIAQELDVSKGTIAYWFKDLDWSKDIKKQLNDRNLKIWKKRLVHLNNLKKEKYRRLYLKAEQEARQEFIKYKKSHLFTAGLAIYWGEGDKIFSNGIIRVANVDPRMLVIFRKFLASFCRVDIKEIKGYLLLYPDLSIEKCLNYWSRNVGLRKDSFYKPSVIVGKHKKNKLAYGVCSIGVNKKYLKKKILTWIDLLAEEL